MNCEIIRDLLPLYADDVCSAASKAAVEQHLESCEACRTELQELRCGETSVLAEEVDSARAAYKAWRKQKFVTIERAVLTMCLLFVIGVVLFYPDMPMPVFEKDINVSNICQLQDGTVYFEWEMTDGTIAMGRHRMIREKDGAYYFVPLCAIIEAHMRYWISVDPTILERQPYDYEYINPYKAWSDWNQTAFDDMSAIYVGWGDDAILVWEEGMELPDAPVAIEEEWAQRMG